MAISYTPRLQLAKPDGDEFQLVGVLDNNYDLIDKYVNVRNVNNNVTPPLAELYDGALVHEPNSGRTWIAVANGAGTFDKHYLAGLAQLWQIPVRTTPMTGLINAAGSVAAFTDPYTRGTRDWNRLFHISWAVTVVASANTANVIQAEAWYNGSAVAYDRHPAVPGTFSNEAYVTCPANQQALFQGQISKVSGTGTIDLTGDPRFSHFQVREEAQA